MHALTATGIILAGIDVIVFLWFLGVGRVRG